MHLLILTLNYEGCDDFFSFNPLMLSIEKGREALANAYQMLRFVL
jgi:hypothetical protein